jgi:LmbE family N-acetylglucosaminyl deacetylase
VPITFLVAQLITAKIFFNTTDFLTDVGRWWKTKEAALRAHRSQIKNIARLFFDPSDTERRLSLEAFRCAPGYDREGARARDLWSGIG